MYFAHLQTQDVEENTNVVPGQRIGTVGNTGNARRTPPHLHFGIYVRGEGPVDPVNFIKEINSTPEEIKVDTEILGQWARSNRSLVSLKATGASRSLKIARLKPHTAMKIQAAAGDEYRVLLPDGLSGYVPAGQVELASNSLEIHQADAVQEVRAAPNDYASVMEKINGGEEFAVLGHYDGYLLVRTHQEKIGWLMSPAAEAGSSKI
jgi:hypothetical protein